MFSLHRIRDFTVESSIMYPLKIILCAASPDLFANTGLSQALLQVLNSSAYRAITDIGAGWISPTLIPLL